MVDIRQPFHLVVWNPSVSYSRVHISVLYENGHSEGWKRSSTYRSTYIAPNAQCYRALRWFGLFWSCKSKLTAEGSNSYDPPRFCVTRRAMDEVYLHRGHRKLMKDCSCCSKPTALDNRSQLHTSRIQSQVVAIQRMNLWFELDNFTRDLERDVLALFDQNRSMASTSKVLRIWSGR